MKVCHITNVHPVFDGRIYHKMVCSTSKNGFEVILVAPLDKDICIDGVQIYGIKKPKYRIFRYLYTFRIKKKLELIDADIYHFHDVELIPLMFKLHKIGKKIIYDIHEFNKGTILHHKNYIPFILRSIIANITWRIEKRACKKFDCCIAATQELADIFYPYSKRIEVMWNYDFKKDIELNNYNAHKTYDLIHTGIIDAKRLDFLMSVAQNLFNKKVIYKWLYVGIDINNFSKILSKYNEIVDKGFVTFIKRVPFEQVANYYKESKIGINYHEYNDHTKIAMPLKIFEYMKHGLVVLTNYLPPISRFLKTNTNGIICDNTIESYTNSILEILGSWNLKEVSYINKSNIFENFNWENQEKLLISLYESLGDIKYESN